MKNIIFWNRISQNIIDRKWACRSFKSSMILNELSRRNKNFIDNEFR